MNEPRRRWRRPVLIGAVLAVGAALALVAANTGGHYFGVTVPKLAPEALAEQLRPHYRIARPEGEGPFPVALLMSGCDGPKDNLDRWAGMLGRRGWATMIVDSHTPRDLVQGEKWRLVCAGQLLMGSERAGDILVAMEDARHLAFADPERILLIGASHGGWSIMDLLAMNPPDRLPHNLARLPDGAPADPLDGLAGALLLYPWCGPANLARREGGWVRPVPTLMILSEDDTIAPSRPCREIGEAMAAAGLPVQAVVFGGVTHGFDQAERSAFSPLDFDPEATAKALELGGGFADAVAARPVRTAR